ncbi:lipocalin family protein [Burkholderia ubonensis]|uniref:lipocalin family protein n=1 Tax=Burkholderia ubonensis TaxID=101571 RepID=UPI0009B493E1|nr:lipocalin family protein [Burkholderia ubonensis]
MKLITRNFLLAAVLLSASNLASALDDRLVGNWQGQRDKDGKCSYMSWTMKRSLDGKFEIAFYKNPEKTQLLNEERGQWETKGDKISLITEGVHTPDVYTYTFTDNDTVHLSAIERDPSVDCMADYEFTDHRVKP